ncbi:MAG: hypothetical protein GC190_21165 [Alphaproteobacteria bacterium]|nr:hypothetical protein [Alphaproteobacteria bacterium]
MERAVHEVGVATIAAAIACVVIPLALFVGELLSHGPGALPAALAILLGTGFIYLWFTLPPVYLTLPLLAYARGRGLAAKALAVLLAAAVAVALNAGPTFAWSAFSQTLEAAPMSASLGAVSAGLYFVVGRLLPRT